MDFSCFWKSKAHFVQECSIFCLSVSGVEYKRGIPHTDFFSKTFSKGYHPLTNSWPIFMPNSAFGKPALYLSWTFFIDYRWQLATQSCGCFIATAVHSQNCDRNDCGFLRYLGTGTHCKYKSGFGRFSRYFLRQRRWFLYR